MRRRSSFALLSFFFLLPVASCSSSDDSSGGGDETGVDGGSDGVVADTQHGGDSAVDTKTDGPGTDTRPPPGDSTTDADAAPPACDPVVLPKLATTPIAGSHTFDQPVFVTQAPGDDTRLYVVEQKGTIQIVKAGAVNATPFLDITSIISGSPGDERGLLGLAFPKNYATTGRFFVGYTPIGGSGAGHNVVAEFHRSASDPELADATEVAQLVSTDDPEDNHDGGWVGFGPDGFLYAGIGDGGGGCDAHGTNGNGQNKDTLLGKMLRLDIDNASGGYAAAGNPFSAGGGLPQIWAYGLRNPWRPSFDMATGDLYIADVGQNAWEEIDVQPAASKGGENYGWREREGTHPSSDSGCSPVTPTPTGLTEPVFDFPHGPGDPIGGSAVMGGYVYRGSAIPGIVGVYFFGDYGSGEVAAFRYCGGAKITKPIKVDDLSGAVSSLDSWGQDNAGEMYIMGQDGNVLKIVPGP